MWFAALSDAKNEKWFLSFVKRLLEGSQPVLSLLQHNPFPSAPPKYIQAVRYRFDPITHLLLLFFCLWVFLQV